MIRVGMPFGDVMLVLVILWAGFAVLIGVCAPKLRGQHVKLALRSLGAAVASLILVIVTVNAIAVFFN